MYGEPSDSEHLEFGSYVSFLKLVSIQECRCFYLTRLPFGSESSSEFNLNRPPSLLQVRPLLKGPVALAAYEWVNGQLGHMMNPIGEMQQSSLARF